ncbi:glycosyltransferase family 2 protein [Fredinandcohnia onubensis]|uniref:glycosyltransferase family 2 protein n=1 Tax=Fredinandcohnia onubensis TaxID=1571209 RepID=UPI001C557A6C|nr:glycosyltransferase family 2 protein [Fredinandcohnia onubensis]
MVFMYKISILMPTYNDAKYLPISIKTILSQTYDNWELIVINDGSTDETEEIVSSYSDSRIKSSFQKNSGQLNAVLTASKEITGDIVLLFHSDDELAHDRVFEEIIDQFTKNPKIEGLYADYLTIDQNGNNSGTMNRPDEIISNYLIKKIFFHKGDNVIGDTFIVKKAVFDEYVLPNYIYDNTIYYINYKNFTILNLKKMEPWYKYRVFGENYIHSEVGKFEVANGCFRTIFKYFSNHFTISPLFVYNNLFMYKVLRKLKFYKSLSFHQNTSIDKNLAVKVYKLWKKELIANDYPEISIKQINKIIQSLNSIDKEDKPLFISDEEISKVEYKFYGKDARRFYNEYTSKELNHVYIHLLENDYDHIVVENHKSKKFIEDVLRFYSFFYDVKVRGN